MPKKKEPNGGDTGNTAPPGTVTPAGQPPTTPADQVITTQTELDKLFKERADRAKRSAVTGVLEELGFEDIDGLKGALSAWKKSQDDKKTELEKLQGTLDSSNTRISDLEGQLGKANEGLKTFMLKTALEREARKESFLDESLEDVWLLSINNSELLEMLEVDVEALTVKGAGKVIKKVGTLKPHWIQKQQRAGTPPPRGAAARAPSQKKREPIAEDGPLVRF